jgi:hypothetical protein
MTGRPTSLGLYVARRLAEVHGGRVTALVEDGRVSVEVRLRGLRTAGQPAEVRADTDAASAAPASEQSSARRVVRTSVT